MKIVIFGCGRTAKELLKIIDNDVIIQGYSDNNQVLHNKLFNDRNVYPPDEIANLDFDYIIVASMFYSAIVKQLTESVGVPREKILIFIGTRCPSDVPDWNDDILSKMVRKTSDIKIGFALSDAEEKNKELLRLYEDVPDFIFSNYEIELFNYKEKSDCGIVIHQDLECMPNYLIARNIALWKGVSFREMAQIRDIPEDYILEGAYIHGVSLILFRGYNSNGQPVISWDMTKDKLNILSIPNINDVKQNKDNKKEIRKIIYVPSPMYRLNTELPVMDCMYAEAIIKQFIGMNERFKSLNIELTISLSEQEISSYSERKYSNINFISQESTQINDIELYDVVITDNSISSFQYTLCGSKVIHFILENEYYKQPKKFLIKGFDYLLAKTVNSFNDMYSYMLELLENDDIFYTNRIKLRNELSIKNDKKISEVLWSEIYTYLKNN